MTEQETGNRPLPDTLRNFVDANLNTTVVRLSQRPRRHIGLAEKLGPKFTFYRDFVYAFIAYRHTPPNDRGWEEQEKLQIQARETGLTGREVLAARRRAEGIYQRWLDEVHKGQVDPNPFRLSAGTDPNVYLQDNSHRKDFS